MYSISGISLHALGRGQGAVPGVGSEGLYKRQRVITVRYSTVTLTTEILVERAPVFIVNF
jgi:hypothetical protein